MIFIPYVAVSSVHSLTPASYINIYTDKRPNYSIFESRLKLFILKVEKISTGISLSNFIRSVYSRETMTALISKVSGFDGFSPLKYCVWNVWPKKCFFDL